MSETNVQYISNERGDLTAVVVPIELWKEIVSELSFEEVLDRIGIE
jgi:hypothetical protein